MSSCDSQSYPIQTFCLMSGSLFNSIGMIFMNSVASSVIFWLHNKQRTKNYIVELKGKLDTASNNNRQIKINLWHVGLFFVRIFFNEMAGENDTRDYFLCKLVSELLWATMEVFRSVIDRDGVWSMKCNKNQVISWFLK